MLHKLYSDISCILFAILCVYITGNTCLVINIGLLNGRGDNTSQKMAEDSVAAWNIGRSNESGVQFKLWPYNVSEATQRLDKFANHLLTKNISLLLDSSGSCVVSEVVSDLLSLPMFDLLGNNVCKERSTHRQSIHFGRNLFSMLPSQTFHFNVAKKILKQLKWKDIGVVYQNERSLYAHNFVQFISGEAMVESMFAVHHKKNGSVEHFSYESLKKIVSSKLNTLVLMFDPQKLQALFDTLASDEINLQNSRMNILILDPIENATLITDRLYTVIGTQVDIQNSSFPESRTRAGNEINDVTVRQALVHDAVMSTGTVLERLVQANKWQTSSEPNHQIRLANAVEFGKEVSKLQLTGKTGNIQFDLNGMRQNMSLQVMNLKKNTFKKIGQICSNGTQKFNLSVGMNFESQNIHQLNTELKIVTIIAEPFVMKKMQKNGSFVYHGFLIDLIKELAKTVKFTYTMYEVEDSDYGRLANGTWTGMVGDILYRKADVALAALSVTSIRQQYVEFPKPYMHVRTCFIRTKDKEKPLNLMQFMEPFTTSVWLILISLCIVIGLVLYSVDYYSPFGWRQVSKNATGEDGTEFNFFNSMWFSFASLLLQGADNTPRSISGRLLVGFFWFSVLIFTSTYTANLAAFFTSSKSYDDANDMETLLKKGYSFSVVKNYALGVFFATSDYKIYNQVYERMALENSFATDFLDGVHKVKKDPNLIYIEEKPVAEFYVEKKPCDLRIVDADLSSTSYSMAVRSHSPYTQALSIGISKLQESGFIEERRKYNWEQANECESNTVSIGITGDGRIQPLQMLGVYAFLVGGAFVAIIVMLVEKWWKKTVAEKTERMKNRLRQSIRLMKLQKKTNVTRVPPRDPNAVFALAVDEVMKEK